MCGYDDDLTNKECKNVDTKKNKSGLSLMKNKTILLHYKCYVVLDNYVSS